MILLLRPFTCPNNNRQIIYVLSHQLRIHNDRDKNMINDTDSKKYPNEDLQSNRDRELLPRPLRKHTVRFRMIRTCDVRFQIVSKL